MSDESLPILCEDCFGNNPYIRMSKQLNGANCKMCDRIYTVYRWNPNRGVGNRSTEICRMCSNSKNLCQTCIKDLQFGLPSQLRDAVLSIENSISVPQNELALVENGDNQWNSLDNPNERLIKMARETIHNRDNKVQQIVKTPKNSEENIYNNNHHISNDNNYNKNNNELDLSLPLPPGINSIEEITNKNKDNKKKKKFALKDGILPPKPKGPPPSDIIK
jgi:hypothetical protein